MFLFVLSIRLSFVLVGAGRMSRRCAATNALRLILVGTKFELNIDNFGSEICSVLENFSVTILQANCSVSDFDKLLMPEIDLKMSQHFWIFLTKLQQKSTHRMYIRRQYLKFD